jgi:hypothetical protein
VLGDSTTVIVPSPPAALLEPERELQVVTIPVPLDRGLAVERLDAWCRNVMTADGDRPVAVTMSLARPSRYPGTIGTFNAAELAAAVEASRGDLWAGMESLGLVRPGLADGPPMDVLEALPGLEREQRRPVVRTHRHPDAGDVVWSLCKLLCICQPE